MVVCITFTVTLPNDEEEQKFLEAFAELQQYVWKNEPGTLTYELLQEYRAVEGTADAEAKGSASVYDNRHYTGEDRMTLTPRRYLVLERYNCERDVHLTHFGSAVFQSFVAKLGKDFQVSAQSLDTYTELPAVLRLKAATKGNNNLSAAADVNVHNQASLPMAQRKGILVFGGAKPGKDAAYMREATKLGELIRKRGVPLIYGGGTVGVMGAVATAVKHGKTEGEGFVVSVIPRSLCPREVSGEVDGTADLLYITETMAERKSIMLASCSLVVSLPGGIGTFDELLEVVTLFQLNSFTKEKNNMVKIGLVNVNHFYDPFLEMLRHLIREGFCEEVVFDYLCVAETAEELLAAMDAYTMPPPAAMSLQWDKRP